MNPHHATGALLLSLPLLFTSPAVELEFTPEEGDSRTVAYEMVLEIELTGYEVVAIINGTENEQEVDELPEDVRTTVENVKYTDDYLTVEDGRLVELERTFEELSMVRTTNVTTTDGDESETIDEGESELLDTAVTFTWDEDDEEYTAAFSDEDSDLDESLLEKLKMTGHLAALLEDGELEEGDEWEIDVDVFNEMAAPGGDHSVIMESEANAEDSDEDEESEEAEPEFDGTVTAEFKEVREEDGVEVAVIALTLELTSEVEDVQEVNINLDLDGEVETGDGTITKVHVTTYELEGELLWNIEEGRAISCEIEGDLETESVETLATEVGDFSLEQQKTITFEGTVSHRITVD